MNRRSFLGKALGFTAMLVYPIPMFETEEWFEQEAYDKLLTKTLELYRERLVREIFERMPLMFWLHGKEVPHGTSVEVDIDYGRDPSDLLSLGSAGL